MMSKPQCETCVSSWRVHGRYHCDELEISSTVDPETEPLVNLLQRSLRLNLQQLAAIGVCPCYEAYEEDGDGDE